MIIAISMKQAMNFSYSKVTTYNKLIKKLRG
jgi:hypothetical protein